jgi:1-acyl-sn-glycerol-3-phosphate acyltransferase
MKKIVLIFFYSLFWRNFLKLIIGLNYINREILFKSKQFILIANHNSHMDTMAIMSSIPIKNISKTHPMAALDFFGGNKIKKFLMRNLINATLIDRNPELQKEKPIQIMDDILKKGRSLLLYPEGSRGISHNISNFKNGLAILIQNNPNIDVIPVYLKDIHKTLPKGSKLIVPFKCKIIFGQPIQFDSYDLNDILVKSQCSLIELKENY